MKREAKDNDGDLFGVYWLVIMCVGLLEGSIGSVIPFLARSEDKVETEYSFFFVAQAVGGLIGYCFLKLFRKSFGQISRRKTIIFCALTNSISSFCFAGWRSKQTAIICMTAYGVGNFGIFNAINTSIICYWQRKAKSKALLLYTALAIGAAISSIMIKQLLLNAFYYFFGLFLIAAIICCSVSKQDQDYRISEISGQVSRSQYMEAPFSVELLFGCALFLYSGVERIISGWMSTYSTFTGLFDERSAPFCVFWFWIIGSICSLIIYYRIDCSVVKKLKVMVVLIFSCGTGVIMLLSIVSFQYLVIVAFIGFGVSCSSVYSLILLLSEEYKIRFYSDQISTMMLGSSLSSLLVGLTGEMMQYSIKSFFYCVWLLSGCLCIFYLLLCAKLKQIEIPRQQRKQLPQDRQIHSQMKKEANLGQLHHEQEEQALNGS